MQGSGCFTGCPSCWACRAASACSCRHSTERNQRKLVPQRDVAFHKIVKNHSTTVNSRPPHNCNQPDCCGSNLTVIQINKQLHNESRLPSLSRLGNHCISSVFSLRCHRYLLLSSCCLCSCILRWKVAWQDDQEPTCRGGGVLVRPARHDQPLWKTTAIISSY